MIKLSLQQALVFMLISTFPAISGNQWAGKRKEISSSSWYTSDLQDTNIEIHTPYSDYNYPDKQYNSSFKSDSGETPADLYLSEIQQSSLKSINNFYGEENQSDSPPRLRIIPGGEPIQGVPAGDGIHLLMVFCVLYLLFIISRKR